MSHGLVVIALATGAAGCGLVGFDAGAGAGRDGPGPGEDGAPAIDAAVSATFFDPFERPDSIALDNGWIEQSPEVFTLAGGQVVRGVAATDWTRNFVHRSAGEDRRDLEVSIEFEVLDVTSAPLDWPQLVVRGRPATFDGYYLWIEEGPGPSARPLHLARKGAAESWWTALATTTVPSATVGQRFRLRLSVAGASPVGLVGSYERFDGGSWTEVVTVQATDDSADAITSAGTWGFGGHYGSAAGPYRYDNFAMQAP